MPYKWEDGTGTRNKAAVFENRLRTFNVNDSLVNFNSVKSGNITHEEILNGEVIGTFSVRAPNTANVTNGTKIPFLTLVNNDPINLMVIDRVYVQIGNASITLPNPLLTTFIDNILLLTSNRGPNIPVINENKSSNVIPFVTAFSNTNVVSATASNILKTIPVLGDINDLILPGSDTIILPGSPTANNTVANINASNVISISIFNNTTAPIVCKVDAFIRFSMIHPGDTG